MKKWNSFIEILAFPLTILLIAIMFRGISSTILSPATGRLIVFPYEIIYKIAEIINYFSAFVIINFPLLVLLRFLSKQYESATPALIGFVAYVLFHIITIFLADRSLPTLAFRNVLGLQIDPRTSTHLVGDAIIYPLEMGAFSALIVGVISQFHYKRSRARSSYGYLSFIDRDVWSYLATIMSTIIVAVAVTYFWPNFIHMLEGIFKFIAYDIANPVNTFIYGITERLLSILNLSRLIRTPFWYGEMGGSWLSGNTSILGDVNIWMSQANAGLFATGAGRFITPHYILNIFAIPAIIITIFGTHTDKLERRRYVFLLVILIGFSVFTGITLPIELFLLFLAPTYFIFHIIMTGVIFAVCQAFNLFIGYSYTGGVVEANPGSIVDLLAYSRDPVMQSTIFKLAILGILVFIVYLGFGILYYRFIALDVLNTGMKNKRIEQLLEAIGGIKNVRRVNSGPTKVIIQVEDALMLDFSKIQSSGAYKIAETRAGYVIHYGPSSTIIRKELEKRMEVKTERPRVATNQ